MDYIIKKSDAANGQFIIKPYTTNGPASPTVSTPLAPNAVTANTSLILLGKGMYEYGELIASDFVHLLENFAGPAAPVYPIQGQLWFDNSTKDLYIHDGTDFSRKLIINGKMTYNVDLNGQNIVNLLNPINDQDATTKLYTDITFVQVAGSSMNSAANITFSGGGTVLGLPATPTNPTEAASKEYVDITTNAIASTLGLNYVLRAGSTMTGDLTMTLDTHIYIPTPSAGFTSNSEVVNKQYVDSAISGSADVVLKSGSTMVGPLIIDGTLLYTGANLTISSVDINNKVITLSGGDYTSSLLTNSHFKATFTDTAGYQVVVAGGAAVPSTPTGLVGDAPATAGYLLLDFGPAVVGTDPTGLIQNIPATSGYQIVTFGISQTGTDLTGLVNDATVYTATITVDGVAKPIAITGSAAQTFADLITEINTDLGASATAALVGGNIKVTSATTGIASTVDIVDSDLFINLLQIGSITPAVAGMDVSQVTYTATITVDGVAKSISIVGNTAQTFTDLITELNTDLGASATADLVGGDIKITSATTGNTSTVTLTDIDLFTSITGFAAATPTPGNEATVSITYTATITVDGVAKSISINGNDAQTFGTLITELNTDLGASATAAIVDSNVRITSNTTGSTSIVSINDVDLFNSLSGYVGILTAIAGTSSTYVLLTTVSSTYNSGPNTTSVTVVEALPATALTGILSALPGLSILDTSVNLAGNLVIAPGHTLDFGGNKITNIGTPTADAEATSKQYVDNLVATSIPPADKLVSGSIDQNTNVLTLVNADSSSVLVSGISGTSHTHIDATISHNQRSLYQSANNRFHDSLTNYSTSPNVPVSDVLNSIGVDLYNVMGRNDRALFPVASYTILNVSNALASDLTITAIVTGASGTITVSGGDFTSTYKAGVSFVVSGNTGVGPAVETTFVVASSTFNVGPNTTTITVVGTINALMTNDGIIQQTYGSIGIAGDHREMFISSLIDFNISSNTGNGNGDYVVKSSTYDNTNTWIAFNSTTPLPAGTNANGIVQLYSFALPFNYTVEANKLSIFNNGIKQYKSVKGESWILPVSSVPTLVTDTTLANGSYTFNIALNGGANNLITVTVAQTLYSVIAVDTVLKKFTITGDHVADFNKFNILNLTGNTNIGSDQYTVDRAVLNGSNTDVYVMSFSVGGLSNDGTLRKPYEYKDLMNAIKSQLVSVTSSGATAIFELGKITFMSAVYSSSSQVVITDVNLFSSLPVNSYTISNRPIGTLYSYREVGTNFANSNVIKFENLPGLGNVLEIINNR